MTKPFIIAELSANHNGSLDRALAIIEAAANSGASAIKFQTYTPESMAVDYSIKDGPWAGQNLIDLYRQAHTPREWHQELFAKARSLGIVPFSSPFDEASVDFLEKLDCPIYKIASFEIVDIPLIRYVASTKKPIFISTGMSTLAEIDRAIEAAQGCEVTLLKCTSAYPASFSDANLVTLEHMRGYYGCDVGISDHTPGIGVAVAAVAIGATVVEKHLTLSRSDGGPDSGFSMEPAEFAQLVTECNAAHQAIGTISYGPTESERPSLALRRSLYFSEDVKAGTVLTKKHLRTSRPALGLPPMEIDNLIGRVLTKGFAKGSPVRGDL